MQRRDFVLGSLALPVALPAPAEANTKVEEEHFDPVAFDTYWALIKEKQNAIKDHAYLTLYCCGFKDFEIFCVGEDIAKGKNLEEYRERIYNVGFDGGPGDYNDLMYSIWKQGKMCPIEIWHAILITFRCNTDGFKVLGIETPWLVETQRGTESDRFSSWSLPDGC